MSLSWQHGQPIMVQEGREHRCCKTFLDAVGQNSSIFQERGHTHSSWPWKKYWGTWGRLKNGRIRFERSLTRVASDCLSGISLQLTRMYYAKFVVLNLVYASAPLQEMLESHTPVSLIRLILYWTRGSSILKRSVLGCPHPASCPLLRRLPWVLRTPWFRSGPTDPTSGRGRTICYSEADAEVLRIGSFCLVDQRAAVVNEKLWWTLKSLRGLGEPCLADFL